ncbi:hypothetical protein GWK47_025601 [Chionoecetes opilio]|uniref:Tc1-like transposase DDE domain-containing protein n=1 Tax=Chionoecetes opilio TaxID=41210 RepID=A0A8J8WLI1_CHIOP|nr:hypothetical protein GWK47_025601 [Chionoecetes opilio]
MKLREAVRSGAQGSLPPASYGLAQLGKPDESTFCVSGGGPARVYRRPGSDPTEARYTRKTTKYPPSLMMWGCFTFHGIGNLVIFPKNTTVNKVVHFDLLNDHLEACFEKTQAQIFQQDGASCHTARDVIQWLDDCKIGRIEDWPVLAEASTPGGGSTNLLLRPLSHDGFCRPVSAARFSFLLTLMGVFTLGRDGSFAVAAAAPCRPTSKTATAEMPANGLGGNVLLWVPSHIRCFPRAAGHRVVSCLSTLGGRAQHHLTSSASLEKLAPERMLRERACGRNRKCPQRGMVSAARRSGRNRTAKTARVTEA